MDSSPDPLDDDLHDLLALYREAVQPPQACEERVRRSLQAAVPSWASPPEPASTGLIPLSPRARRALVLTLSAAAALALTFGLSSYLDAQHQGTPARLQSPYTQPDRETSSVEVRGPTPLPQDREHRDATRRDAEPEPVVEPMPGAADDDSAQDRSEPNDGSEPGEGRDGEPLRPRSAQRERPEPRSPQGARDREPSRARAEATTELRGRGPSPTQAEDDAPPRDRAPTHDPADAPASLDLARELSLIREAERHLRAGHQRQALAAIDRHRREFPEGQLEPEREASRVTLLCLQGDAPEAQRRAKRFAERWPTSPLLPRVRRVCDAT